MRVSLLVCLLINTIGLFSQQANEVILTNEHLGLSNAYNVGVFEDVNNAFKSINEISQLDKSKFIRSNEKILSFDFTKSTYWLYFSLHNQTKHSRFYLETGRTVTNEVQFYELDENNTVLASYQSGDDFPYADRPIPHRKHLFPVEIEPNERKQFFIKLRSDGEMLFAPVKFHEPTAFYQQDFKDQFKNGFYYGLIALTVVIYFFFYYFLKDRTFLFYIFYVFSQGMLQFSLDGYGHHHFFSGGGYFTNHAVLFFAGLTVIFLLVYVHNFLSLKERNQKLSRIFYWCRIVIIFITIISLIPGFTYEIAYPIINGSSLVIVLFAALTIILIRMQGYPVDFFFASAFIILIIGGVVFILGNLSIVGDKEVSLGALKISSALEFVVLSISMSSKYGKLQKEKIAAQKEALQTLKEKNELMDRSNILLEQQVHERTKEIERQKEELEHSNQSIVSSIRYAKRIQQAILPSATQIEELLPEAFVFYRAKDVVSGDFYFVESTQSSLNHAEEYVVFAAVDCTGHGVPGAFMSIVGNNILSLTLQEESVNTPALALDFLNKGVTKTLRQEQVYGATIRDGMDIALCAMTKDRSKLMYAGAKNPLYLIRSKEKFNPDELPMSAVVKKENENCVLLEIKGDKFPIGDVSEGVFQPFTNHEINLKKGDQITIFSDGYADQFGGPKHKKFNYSRFKSLLVETYSTTQSVQEQRLIEAFDDWKGESDQIDDVLVISLRI